jgi:hypothetical protein
VTTAAEDLNLEMLARHLAEGLPFDEIVREAVSAAVHVIDAAEDGSVTILDDGEIRSAGEVSPIAATIEAIEREEREGPCLDAAERWQTCVVDDIERAAPWPRFRARVMAETPIRSVLAYAVPGTGGPRAALNLYSTAPSAFDRDAERLGALFAAQIAVALALEDERRAGRSQVHQLEEALLSRDIIGQAKGILMEREGCTADEAFDMLRRVSQKMNRKLRDVAGDVVSDTAPSNEPG